MATFPLDDLQLTISDGDAVGVTFHNSTIVGRWGDDGGVEFVGLRLDGVPYPRRGGPPSPFEAELARRIYRAVERDYERSPDYYHQCIEETDGFRPGGFDPQAEWGLRARDVL